MYLYLQSSETLSGSRRPLITEVLAMLRAYRFRRPPRPALRLLGQRLAALPLQELGGQLAAVPPPPATPQDWAKSAIGGGIKSVC